jgi:hypothetical protein
LCSQNFTKIDQTCQDLKLGGPRNLTSATTILGVELVQIIDQGVLLTQSDSIVQETSANNFHYSLDLIGIKVDSALSKPSKNGGMGNLHISVGAASTLHPTGVDYAF